ncbi:hypothetical protein QBC38DRAFT_459779 [Podospora fimiseda]|uniref:RNase H type-1 domain-containing protein n=1 Tax=Podospora fimiseda TaxID=252190 RepID=A0AAN6YS82_9PEZI|nr:hypothetical protein QBC38DRAFT_459779 [Podospora fimiseda]
MGLNKEKVAKAFCNWYNRVAAEDLIVFSDGSQKKDKLGYGYTVFRGAGEHPIATGLAGVHTCAVVFDAEALGALRGLKHAVRLAERDEKIWFQEAADAHPGGVRVKWAPGHKGIEGNELADDGSSHFAVWKCSNDREFGHDGDDQDDEHEPASYGGGQNTRRYNEGWANSQGA